MCLNWNKLVALMFVTVFYGDPVRKGEYNRWDQSSGRCERIRDADGLHSP